MVAGRDSVSAGADDINPYRSNPRSDFCHGNSWFVAFVIGCHSSTCRHPTDNAAPLSGISQVYSLQQG